MHALRDIETQRIGIVGLAYNVGAGFSQGASRAIEKRVACPS